jgi:2-isopropylmalate synthase
MLAADIWQIFNQTYLEAASPVNYRTHHLFEQGALQGIRLEVAIDGVSQILTGEGNGPIDAAVHALKCAGIDVQVRSYDETAMRCGGESADACAFIEIAHDGGSNYGVGIDANIVTAAIKALLSGVNRKY